MLGILTGLSTMALSCLKRICKAWYDLACNPYLPKLCTSSYTKENDYGDSGKQQVHYQAQEENQEKYTFAIEDLPTDIAIEILRRLKTRALIYFKCVCKAWYELANNPDLLVLFRSRWIVGYSTGSPGQLFLIDEFYLCDTKRIEDKQTKALSKLELPFMTRCLVESCVSCNDILMVSYHTEEGNKYKKVPEVSIYNPWVEKFVTLPDLGIPVVPVPYSKYIYGFGFHPHTKQYKVVFYHENVRKISFHVFTLGTSEWRRVDIGPYRLAGHRPGVFVTVGALNWVGCREPCDSLRGRIVAFDLFKEEFRSIAMHPSDTYGIPKALFTIEGSLSYLWEDRNNQMVSLWSMVEYGVEESWTKKFSVRGCVPRCAAPLLLLPNENLFLMDYSRNGFYYDIKTGSHKRLELTDLPNYTKLTTLEPSLLWPFT